MDIRAFAKEVLTVTPAMHAMFVKGLPSILKEGRITFPQVVIIEILRSKKECRMSDLSNALGVTKAAVTGLADRLIKARLAKRERSQDDRRIVRVSLTPKGARLSDTVRDYKLKLISRLFSSISRKERVQYLNILKKVQKNISGKK